MPSTTASQMRNVCQREKCSMMPLVFRAAAGPSALMRLFVGSLFRCRRLALDAPIGEHGPHGRHFGPAPEVDLELTVVDDLGHLADQPTARDDGIAATDIGEHLGHLLHLLALRADNKEIHD